MDNIGGISECWYVLEEDVETCAILRNGILIDLKSGKTWEQFPCTSKKTDVQINPAGDKLGTYNVAISVSIPDNNLDEDKIHELNDKHILFKYRTGNGKIFVAGDKEYFLQVTAQRLSPRTASGYSGMQINISGVLPHLELPII